MHMQQVIQQDFKASYFPERNLSVKSADLTKLASFVLNVREKINFASEFNLLFKTK